MSQNNGQLNVILSNICQGKTKEIGYLQVIEIGAEIKKKISVVLSDSVGKVNALVSTQCSDLFRSGQIILNSVIALKTYTLIQGKPFITSLKLIQTECDFIGSPKASSVADLIDYNQQLEVNRSLFDDEQNISNNHMQKELKLNEMIQNQQRLENTNYSPISSLSPYGMSNWIIKARITQKNEVREWDKTSSGGNKGKLISWLMMDQFGTEISVTAFNEECEKFSKTIIFNKIYTLTKARIKQDNFRRKRIMSDYAITCTKDTVITLVDDKNFAERQYTFTKFNDLKNCINTNVDVLAVVKKVSEINEFTSQRTNKQLKKRCLTLIDDSNQGVECTLWNETAMKFGHDFLSPGTIIFLSDVRVGDYGGISLSANLLFKGQDIPNVPDVKRLQKWINNGDIKKKDITFLTNKNSNEPIEHLTWLESEEKRCGLNPKDKGINVYKGCYFFIQGTISSINSYSADFNNPRKPYYKAVPNPHRNAGKKVEASGKRWICMKDGTMHDSYDSRYAFSFKLSDYTDGKFVGSFNEVATKLIGQTANEIELLENNSEKWEKALKAPLFKTMNFKIRAKEDNWQDQSRVRYICFDIGPIDYLEECEKLVLILEQD